MGRGLPVKSPNRPCLNGKGFVFLHEGTTDAEPCEFLRTEAFEKIPPRVFVHDGRQKKDAREVKRLDHHFRSPFSSISTMPSSVGSVAGSSGSSNVRSGIECIQVIWRFASCRVAAMPAKRNSSKPHSPDR